MNGVPNGYVKGWDQDTWNVGFMFRWSAYYGRWVDAQQFLTVKPGQTLVDAFRARTGRCMWPTDRIFFVDS